MANKLTYQRLIYLILFFFLSNFGYSDPSGKTLIMGLRSNSTQLGEYIEKTEIREIPSETVEFANGNTVVRVKGQLACNVIYVLVPTELTADDLMEALIKIRTAHSRGAKQVIVVTTEDNFDRLHVLGKNKKVLNLDLKEMFSVAGADGVQDQNGIGALNSVLPFKRHFSSQKSFVTSQNHEDLGKDLARILEVPYVEHPTDENIFKSNVFLISAQIEPVNDEFFKTLYQIREYKKKGASVNFIAPYLPYARSDKSDQPGVSVTGRLIADLIQHAGADSVTFMRAHAPQSEGFFNIPTVHVNGRATITNFLKSQESPVIPEVVVAPDAGAQKDDTLYADELGLPIVVANKQRDPLTAKTKFLGFSGGITVRGRAVIIIDDETASGSTLAQTAEHLKAEGALTVVAVVTHLAGKAEKALESPSIDYIVVTNTYPVTSKNPKLIVVSSANEIAEGLRPLINHNFDLCAEILSGVVTPERGLK